MASDKDQPTKEYRGYVEVEGKRIPLSIFAADAKEAYPAILHPRHETAAHATCDEYWHGTGDLG